MLFSKVNLVGATGIEPVTPTVSRLASDAGSVGNDTGKSEGADAVPGFCQGAPPYTITAPCCETFARAIKDGPVSWLPAPGDSVSCPWCEREIEGIAP